MPGKFHRGVILYYSNAGGARRAWPRVHVKGHSWPGVEMTLFAPHSGCCRDNNGCGDEHAGEPMEVGCSQFELVVSMYQADKQ